MLGAPSRRARMNTVNVDHLDDPRLTDYRAIKDRQWLAEFQPGRQSDPAAPHGKFMAEGETVVQLLAASKFTTLSVLATPTRLASCEPHLRSLPPSTPVYVIDQRRMNELIGFPMHRGMLAIGARPAPQTLGSFLGSLGATGPLVVMEDLTNHDNVGSIFRSASCLGAAGVVLSPRCADPLYRKSVRVSMGHVLKLPFCVAERWPEALDVLRGAGWRLVVLTPGTDAVDIRQLESGEPRGVRSALLVGTEGQGVSTVARDLADVRVRIGMVVGVDSLNVSVSAAIALHRMSNL